MLPMCVLVLLFTNCKTMNSDNGSSVSSIKVKKNGVQWSETAATASFNTKDSIVSIMGVEGNETFTLRFKKPASNLKIEKFETYTTLSPTRLSAAISDRYELDVTQSNKLQIRIVDNSKKRLTGDFYLHLKRDKAYGNGSGETFIYQGRFDVLYEEISI